MDKRKAIALATILSCCLLLIGAAMAAPAQLEIEWRVIASGGGHLEASPYVLDSSIGQALVGLDNLASTVYVSATGAVGLPPRA